MSFLVFGLRTKFILALRTKLILQLNTNEYRLCCPVRLFFIYLFIYCSQWQPILQYSRPVDRRSLPQQQTKLCSRGPGKRYGSLYFLPCLLHHGSIFTGFHISSFPSTSCISSFIIPFSHNFPFHAFRFFPRFSCFVSFALSCETFF
jgi:hypothetical protein